MNNKILELKNVCVSYDNNKTFVLNDISFEVEKWQTLSIIWLNWSWKSTLLKTIAWIQKLSSWKIKKENIKISYVPQKVDIDKSFPINVVEFINIFNKNIEKEKIISYFEKFNSKYLIDKNISNLSWWEFQKMLIISSIVNNPDLILLDEPTSWIDIIWEEIFYEIINDLKKLFPDISLIIVSHNIHLVYKYSQKVICLHENNFCCHGTPWEIKNNDSIKKIFWEYIAPYEHNPHDNHIHEVK